MFFEIWKKTKNTYSRTLAVAVRVTNIGPFFVDAPSTSAMRQLARVVNIIGARCWVERGLLRLQMTVLVTLDNSVLAVVIGTSGGCLQETLEHATSGRFSHDDPVHAVLVTGPGSQNIWSQ